jgi:hypothetical protein
VRLFGVGATRPEIVLGDATPGFQKGLANMVIFAGAKRDPARAVAFPPPGSVPFNKDVPDANSGTFYTAISNVDFTIGKGNPAATAIRFHAAQHAFVSHGPSTSVRAWRASTRSATRPRTCTSRAGATAS